MSNKAQALVWDLECPKQYGEVAFKPSHKYVLIAYADHADHNGKNIWPAVPTIAKKTGLDDRTIQRLTGDLVTIGLLIEDGTGPRGTNKWKLPYNPGGDKLTPLTNCRGDNSPESLGDIPSGDIPSGDKLTPELKEPEHNTLTIWEKFGESIYSQMPRSSFDEYIKPSKVIDIQEDVVIILTADDTSREWLEDRVTAMFKQYLVGAMSREMDVAFVIGPEA
jgi:hypothetical protein